MTTTPTLTRSQRNMTTALDQHLGQVRRRRVAARTVATCSTLTDDQLAERLDITPKTARRYRTALRGSGHLRTAKVRCADGVALLDQPTTETASTPTALPDALRLGDRVWRVATDPTNPSVRTFLVDGDEVHLEPVGHAHSAEGQAALRAAADKFLNSTAALDPTYTPGTTRPKGGNAVRKTVPVGWVK